MRRRSIVLLLVCVFVAGVFFGIWADWRVMKARYGHQNLKYQVQNYPRANLAVYPGDKITLVPPKGGSGADLHMNFVGYSPCTTANGSNPCEIKQNGGTGPFFFTCSSTGGNGSYSCPDPGIQQSPTIPYEIKFVETAETDIASLVGVHLAPPAQPEPAPIEGGHPAASAITAYVSCDDTGKTLLQDLNGNSFPSNTITVPKNETVFWISSQNFTLDSSKFPVGLCSNGNPPGGSLTETQCDVALSGETAPYVVQAQATPACSVLNATLVTQ
jgi:hypothetical protein